VISCTVTPAISFVVTRTPIWYLRHAFRELRAAADRPAPLRDEPPLSDVLQEIRARVPVDVIFWHNQPVASSGAWLAACRQYGADRFLSCWVAFDRPLDTRNAFLVSQEGSPFAPRNDELSDVDVFLESRVRTVLVTDLDVASPTHLFDELHLEDGFTRSRFLAEHVATAFDQRRCLQNVTYLSGGSF
jgi:hypothetical protein